MARVLIVGGDGLIGAALARNLAAHGWDVVRTTRRPSLAGLACLPLDLAGPTARDTALPDVDVAIFSAAMARFADCRASPEIARAVNVDVPVALATRLARCGTRSILLSTSAVFDGAYAHVPATAAPSPTSIYGTLKAEAEQGFLALSPAGTVIRLTKVLDPHHALFCRWRAALERDEAIDAFDDLRLAPISLAAVTAAVLSGIDRAGLIQVSALDDITYYDAALALAWGMGRPGTLVRRASAERQGIPPCDRPGHTSLDTGELSARIPWRPEDPRDLIKRLFVTRRWDPAELPFP